MMRMLARDAPADSRTSLVGSALKRGLARLILASILALVAADAFAQSSDGAFSQLGEEYLHHWLARNPQIATRLGLHDTDDLLIPVTQASLAEETRWAQGFRDRLAQVPRAQLSFDRALEYDLLTARVHRELLDLEVIRPFENNPNAYLELTAGAVQSLLQRDFASLCARLHSARKRLQLIPEVLRAAQVNLRNPPRIYTEVAIAQFDGALRLYRVELPAIAARCKDPDTQADLAEADSAAVHATEEFIRYLREGLLPRSSGAFAIGKETYQKKLAYDEMESMPVDSILARGLKEIEATRRRMEALAQNIAPGGGVRAALDSLERDRPSADSLVPYVSRELDHIRAFLREKDLITMPSRENLTVRETPVFRRSTSFASMESPGVWEKKASEAYYNVTPVDPSWSEARKRDHLGFFNHWSSEIVSIHEALPGHYYQFLALQKVPSRLRQVLNCGTNTEGWAHYCEQMAIEQGYGGGDPRYSLAQLNLALQRLGRLVVGISLHTQGMSYEDAVKLFEERCYMAPVIAEREARRGTLDPTYLVYTLGKWRILDLRDEVRAHLGANFRLREFHDAFLRQGGSALPVVRAGLLKDLHVE